MGDTNTTPAYEKQFTELETIVKRLDNATTPIDELAQNVKRGAALTAREPMLTRERN